MAYPSDLRYTDQHEWIRIEGDVAVIGITHHAQDQLGDIVHVELPAVGRAFAAGDSACEVESVKAVSDVYAPIGGTVTEVNGALDGNEGVINSDPHAAGWLWKMTIADRSQLDGLMDAAAYTALAGD